MCISRFVRFVQIQLILNVIAPWMRRLMIAKRFWYPSTNRHGVTTHKIAVLIVTAMVISDVIHFVVFNEKSYVY
jgi:hypothetical protein